MSVGGADLDQNHEAGDARSPSSLPRLLGRDIAASLSASGATALAPNEIFALAANIRPAETDAEREALSAYSILSFRLESALKSYYLERSFARDANSFSESVIEMFRSLGRASAAARLIYSFRDHAELIADAGSKLRERDTWIEALAKKFADDVEVPFAASRADLRDALDRWAALAGALADKLPDLPKKQSGRRPAAPELLKFIHDLADAFVEIAKRPPTATKASGDRRLDTGSAERETSFVSFVKTVCSAANVTAPKGPSIRLALRKWREVRRN